MDLQATVHAFPHRFRTGPSRGVLENQEGAVDAEVRGGQRMKVPFQKDGYYRGMSDDEEPTTNCLTRH